MKVQKLSIYFLIGVSVFFVSNSFGQISHLSNNGGAAGNYVGWNATNNFPLEIRHNGSENMDFYTDSIQRMTIKGDGTNDGFVGIGTSTPGELLDVAGNINVSDDQWYGIDGNRILANEGTDNLFVGVGAGASITTGHSNTFIGRDAGNSQTTGIHTTAIGYFAGQDNTAEFNCFVGSRSGGYA